MIPSLLFQSFKNYLSRFDASHLNGVLEIAQGSWPGDEASRDTSRLTGAKRTIACQNTCWGCCAESCAPCETCKAFVLATAAKWARGRAGSWEARGKSQVRNGELVVVPDGRLYGPAAE